MCIIVLPLSGGQMLSVETAMPENDIHVCIMHYNLVLLYYDNNDHF